MDKEKVSIAKCRELIEHSLNWGDSTEWGKKDFEILSDKIFDKTQVRLSVSTLKRLWGKVRYDSAPTPSTLNTLTKFLGFENWRDFQQKHSTENEDAEIPQLKTQAPRRSMNRRFLQVASMACVVIIGLALVFLLSKGKTPITRNFSNVLFKAHKVSDDLPNSVVFNYDASGFKTDSVIIQQSWDPKRRERVSASHKEHTSIYYIPGYFAAKLIVDDEIIKEDVVFIQTKGWKGIIDSKPPVYISNEDIRLPESLGITSALMREKTGESVFNERGVMLTNVREFDGLKGSNFTLNIKLKNTATVEECLCRNVKITILTKGGAIIIPLSAKGCIAQLNLLTPDGWVSGKENDLSAFGCDFNDFEHVVCTVENQKLYVRLNGTEIFNKELEYSVDEIIGLRIGFEGAGEIKEVKLSNPEKVVYEERFGASPRSTDHDPQ